ncbi:chlorophyll synthesis pathway protein BchC [Lichtheimia ornata]|uniref:Chlorophyll synthesis pathway protein BchC n=1 Tax=Lichtheimia ornata TaxID=688661 RepID=A0AAD7VAP1_9FUNG|nr:chlorophyll synthesis pathway protein BchC [Lichtheimia ornata]KAJ8661990.1 chlorophyll synthesis pathway protein BchC [Lichtheimia ornata]
MAPSTTMKVASWETTGTISTVDKQIPELKPGYILVRVTASGICGTDLHICKGETPHATHKVTIGHENAGFVEQIHPDTVTTVKQGDLVAIDPNIPCHACTFCRNKKYHLCPKLICLGVSVNGGMAKYMAAPAEAVFPVPQSVGPVTASLAEPLSCVIHAVDTGSIKTGDQVLVMGAGPIGLMTLGLASLAGGRVTVVEPSKMRREKALAFGAAEVLDPEELKLGDPCMGDGFDVVFECVGRPQTMELAVNCAKAGGTVVWVGVAKPDVTIPVSPFNVYRRELTIKSTYTNPYGMERAIKVLAENKLDWGSLITHSFTLDQFEEAWKVFLDGSGLKVCVRPNEQ